MACALGTPLSITAAVDGNVAYVTVAGEIDPSTVGTFSTVLLTLASDGVDQFVIDTSAVTFVDSTAIQALKRLVETPEPARVTLISPTHRLLDLLLATGLDSLITVTARPR